MQTGPDRLEKEELAKAMKLSSGIERLIDQSTRDTSLVSGVLLELYITNSKRSGLKLEDCLSLMVMMWGAHVMPELNQKG